MSLSKTSETLKKVNPQLAAVGDDIENTVEQLREEIARLAASLQKISSEKASEYRDGIGGIAETVSESSQALLKASRHQAGKLEDDLLDHVARHPYQALALAAGAGALLALFSRRS